MASFDIFTVNVFNLKHVSYRTCVLLANSLYKFDSNNNNINLKCVTRIKTTPPTMWNKAGEIYTMMGEHASKVVSDGFDLCLNQMISDYVIFCHSDTVILHKNWDNIIIELLEKYKMVGVPYFNGVWGFCPSPIFCCAKKETWRSMSMSFSAKIKNNRIVQKSLNEQESKVLNHPVGTRIKFDVGWQIPFKLNELGYNCHVFPTVVSDLFFKKEERCRHIGGRLIPRKISTEWAHNGNLFLAHFQGIRMGKDLTLTWIDRVRNFLDGNSN